MSVEIRVYSDYVCPFCFLAEFPLKEAAEGRDVRVEWRPFELRPEPTPTLRPEGDYLQRAWRQSVYPLAERMGVLIVLPRVSPQPHTHLAFEGFRFAREHGKGNEYTDRLFRAFFQEDQDIGDVDVLTGLAGEVGLDEAEYRRALESRKYREAHQAALRHAVEEMGITSVPTFVIGRHVLEGLQSRETLVRAIEAAEADS
jgi:predicted DsbA family dithiol-disulfide isomerase